MAFRVEIIKRGQIDHEKFEEVVQGLEEGGILFVTVVRPVNQEGDEAILLKQKLWQTLTEGDPGGFSRPDGKTQRDWQRRWGQLTQEEGSIASLFPPGKSH